MGRVGDSYRGRRRSACGLTWFQWGLLVSVLGIVSVGGLPALPDGYVTRTVVSGIGFSTDICFLPAVGGKDRFIVTQKDGLVLTVIGKNMLSEPFLDLRSIVNTHHDRGLTACEIHPGYPATPRAFFMYTVENDASQATKAKTAQVARFDITGSGNTAVRQSKVILLGSVIGPGCDKISMTADVLCADSFTHSTGGLAWDPDGNLFVTMGDGSGNKPSAVTMRATKGVSLNGKVLRIDPENGNGVPGNPLFTPGVLATSNKAKVWSLGCRNCWRIYYDTFIKAPVIAEVGWAAIEEVNVAFKNANLGWPCVEGTRQNAGFADFNRCRAFNAGQPKEGQRQDPMVSWTHQEGAVSFFLPSHHWTPHCLHAVHSVSPPPLLHPLFQPPFPLLAFAVPPCLPLSVFQRTTSWTMCIHLAANLRTLDADFSAPLRNAYRSLFLLRAGSKRDLEGLATGIELGHG